MIRYFFDVNDGVPSPDVLGRDLTDHDAARKAAVDLATDHIRRSADLMPSGAVIVSVRDEAGDAITQVRAFFQIE